MSNTQTYPIVFTDSTPMPFGVHRGKAMVNVPAKYLLWLYNKGCDHSGVSLYIQENLDALNKEAGNGRR